MGPPIRVPRELLSDGGGMICSGSILNVMFYSGGLCSGSIGFAYEPPSPDERIVDNQGKVWRCGPGTGWQMVPEEDYRKEPRLDL